MEIIRSFPHVRPVEGYIQTSDETAGDRNSRIDLKFRRIIFLKKTGRVFCNFELWPWWQKRPSNDHGQSVHSFSSFSRHISIFDVIWIWEFVVPVKITSDILLVKHTSDTWSQSDTLSSTTKLSAWKAKRSWGPTFHLKKSDGYKEASGFPTKFQDTKIRYIYMKIPQVFVQKISMAVSCKLSLSLSLYAIDGLSTSKKNKQKMWHAMTTLTAKVHGSWYWDVCDKEKIKGTTHCGRKYFLSLETSMEYLLACGELVDVGKCANSMDCFGHLARLSEVLIH